MRRILVGMMMVAALSSGGAQAQPAIEKIEEAFATGQQSPHVHQLSEMLNALMRSRRPADGSLRRDPLLNGLFGRFHAAVGDDSVALAYLQQADSKDVPAPQRVAALLALAELQRKLGDFEAEAATLTSLHGLPLSPDQERDVTLDETRLLLLENPAEALSRSRSLLSDPDPVRRFEAEYVAAIAYSLMEDRAAATEMAQRTWNSAAQLPPREFGPLKAALLQAGLAAHGGDMERLLAMLSAAGTSHVQIDGATMRAIPVCGDRDVTPEDHVIFGLADTSFEKRLLIPIAASRPQAVGPFYRALSGVASLDPESAAVGGTVFTVRCKPEQTAHRSPSIAPDRLVAWFAQRGLFAPLFLDVKPETISAIESEIASVQQQYGEEHPFLIPLRLALTAQIQMRALVQDAVPPMREVNALYEQAFAALRKGGADFVPEAPGGEPQNQGPLTLFAVYSAAMPTDMLYEEFLDGIEDADWLPEDQKIAMLERIMQRFEAEGDEAGRRAAMIQIGNMRRKSGDVEAARTYFRAAGLPETSCRLADDKPKLAEGTITSDDYPVTALQWEFEGTTSVAFALGQDGNLTSKRIILSSPSRIFDDVVLRAMADFQYEPPVRNGRPQGCSGLVQRVWWSLPEDRTGTMPYETVDQQPN